MKTQSIKIVLTILLFGNTFSNVNAQNTWLQKANYGGGATFAAIGFAIGNYGYIGGGTGGTQVFWEYDKANDIWTQKANLGGGPRGDGVGFAIANKGYICLGHDINGSLMNDLWEYDPILNIWTQKLNFPGGGRDYGVGFTIGNKGYVGTGGIYQQDFWEYNPLTDTWLQRTNLGGTGRISAIGFSIGNKGYLGTGTNSSSQRIKDIWQFNPLTNTWAQIADFPNSIDQVVSFTIGSRAYLCTGVIGLTGTQQLWAYDTLQNTWIQKMSFPGLARWRAVGFAIGNKGYVGTGSTGSASNDFYEYTPDSGFVGLVDFTKKIEYVSVFPNPIKNKISISYSIFKKAETIIELYNQNGQKLKTLLKGMQNAGEQHLSFDFSDFNSAVYYLKLSVDGITEWKKIVKD